MGTRKSGACEAEQPELEVELGPNEDLGTSDRATDTGSKSNDDDRSDFDTDDDLGIELDLDSGTEAEFSIEDPIETGEVNSNVGETSVEIDVEELIAELEADRKSSPEPEEPSSRKRLEDILEERRIANELDDIDEFDAIDIE
jgi:hypothetical protein